MATLLEKIEKDGPVRALLSKKDAFDQTPLCCALTHQRHEVLPQLLTYTPANVVFESLNEEMVMWLARNSELHWLLSWLLSAASKADPSQRALAKYSHKYPDETSSALVWAAYVGYVKVVWVIMSTTSPNASRDRLVRSAESLAKFRSEQWLSNWKENSTQRNFSQNNFGI